MEDVIKYTIKQWAKDDRQERNFFLSSAEN